MGIYINSSSLMNASKDYWHAFWYCVRWSNAMRIGVGGIPFHACDHTPFQWNRGVLSAWTHAKTSATKWQDTFGKQAKADNWAVKQLFAVLVNRNRRPCRLKMIGGYLIDPKWHAVRQLICWQHFQSLFDHLEKFYNYNHYSDVVKEPCDNSTDQNAFVSDFEQWNRYDNE